MTQDDATLNAIRAIAEDALTEFEFVSTGAKAALQVGRTPSADSFAAVNTLTGERAVRNIGAVGQAERESLRRLASEPAIARVTLVGPSGVPRVIFICRAATLRKSGR